MLCFKEVAANFFKEHFDRLQSNYPGFSLNRLMKEMESLSYLSSVNKTEYLESAYLPEEKLKLENFFQKLLEGVPLAYISGKSFFYESEFTITKDVLIPRYETEMLVSHAVEFLSNSRGATKLLDVGVGSGAILLSILRAAERPLKAIGSDISLEALSVARRNAFNLKFSIPSESKIDFVLSDRLNSIQGEFDLIVSNPPYIKKTLDKPSMHAKVLEFEPAIALFLEDESYDQWFIDFFRQVKEHLLIDGLFLMEGHEDHLERLLELLEGFREKKILSDLTGRPRFLSAKK